MDAHATAHRLELEELLREVRDRLPAKPVTEMGRAAFDALSPTDAMAFVKSGGRVMAPATPGPLAAPDELPRVVLRSTWQRWPDADKARFLRGGGKLHDR